MLNIFKKKNELLETEVVVPLNEEPENEYKLNSLTIPVRDIKQYLVDEFDRSRDLQDSIEAYERKEEEYYKTKMKYDATLVVVEEYKERNDYLEDRLHDQKLRYEDKLRELTAIEEEKNDLRIRIVSLENKLKEIDKVIDEGVNKQLLELSAVFKTTIENHRGNLSKKLALEYLKDGVEKIGSYRNGKKY